MNNRQAGRRRGRGGQRPQGGGSNQQGNGNRIDNRARGNAAQLLEKYRNLARDAQMQGDRVNAEYFFQFADHYFRVLSETRTRFEENQQQPRRPRDEAYDEDGDYELEGDGNRADEPREHEIREARDERHNGRVNGNGNGSWHADDDAEPQPQPQPQPQAERRDRDDEGGARRRGRPRRDEGFRRDAADAPAGIDAAVLPPAISADPAPAGDAEEKPRRRGRPRRDEAPLV